MGSEAFDYIIVGRGVRGLRAGQPPVGGPREPRAAARGGRQGQQPDGADPAGLRQAARATERFAWFFPTRPIGKRERVEAGCGARRSAAPARSTGWSTTAARQADWDGLAAVTGNDAWGWDVDRRQLPGDRGQPARRVADAWRRRAARASRPARSAARSADEMIDAGDGDRAPARRRPQRVRRRTHRVRDGEHQERPAGQRRRGVPAPGRRAPEPHGRDRLARHVARVRGRQGGRRAHRRAARRRRSTVRIAR